MREEIIEPISLPWSDHIESYTVIRHVDTGTFSWTLSRLDYSVDDWRYYTGEQSQPNLYYASELLNKKWVDVVDEICKKLEHEEAILIKLWLWN